MNKVGTLKSLPRSQVSDDLLWAINGNNNCFLRKSQGVTFSLDPTNLSGINLKRDSGITSQEGIGITTNVAERKVKDKKIKKRAFVTRFDLNLRSRKQLSKKKLVARPSKNNKVVEPTTNHTAITSQRDLTARAIYKVVKRSLKNYRPDLHDLAFKKLRILQKSKLRGKNLNKRDLKLAQSKN